MSIEHLQERAFPLQVDAVDDSSDDASEGAVALWVSVPAATLPRSGEHEIAVSVGGGDFGAGVYWHAATVHVPGDSRRSLEGKAPDPFVPAAARYSGNRNARPGKCSSQSANFKGRSGHPHGATSEKL